MVVNKIKKVFVILAFAMNLQAFDLGPTLFHGNCTTCHFEKKTVSAPAVVDFKKIYLKKYPKKEDFICHMTKFVKKPDPKISLMPKAIKKHELMPEIFFEEDTLDMIIEYIYKTDFTKPHEGHF